MNIRQTNSDVKLGDFVGALAEQSLSTPVVDAVSFLKLIDATGWHNLVAIRPDAPEGCVPSARTFPPGAWVEMQDWIDQRNGKENLYFAVNEPRPGAPDTKLKKHDIAAIRCVFADLDPAANTPLEEARADIARLTDTLCSGSVPPTVALDSGGGSQFFWCLSKKLDAQEHREAAEAQGRSMAALVGGDSVQNIDRIMRLPFTQNLPDAGKRAKGRTSRLARVTHQPGARWSLEVLSSLVAPADTRSGVVGGEADVQAAVNVLDMSAIESCDRFDDLPADIRSRFAAAREQSQSLQLLWSGFKAEGDSTSSGYLASLAASLARLGFDAQDFGHLAWVWPVMDRNKGREMSVTLRALARAWGRIGAPAVFDASQWWEEPAEGASSSFFPAPPTDGLVPYTLLSTAELFNRPDPKFVIDRHIPEASVGFLYGDPGTGKSFIALDWALHMAFGQDDWFGDKIDQPDGAAVIYLAGEGASGFKSRVSAWMTRHAIDPGHRDHFYLLAESVNFMAPDDVKRLALTLRQSISGPVGMVVVDTVSRAMPGADENLQKEMTLFVRACDAIKAAFGCVVLGVHHANKNGDMRGSTVLLGAGDFVFKLDRKKGASVGRLHCEKQKDAPDGWSNAYRFDVVQIGADKASLVPARCSENVGPNVELTPALSARVLNAMRAAWAAGEPWAKDYRAKDRMAARLMVRDFGFDEETASNVIDMWERSRVIVMDTLSKGSKRRGYRVVADEENETASDVSAFG